MVGRTFELKEEFLVFGGKQPTNRSSDPDSLLIMPPREIGGTVVAARRETDFSHGTAPVQRTAFSADLERANLTGRGERIARGWVQGGSKFAAAN